MKVRNPDFSFLQGLFFRFQVNFRGLSLLPDFFLTKPSNFLVMSYFFPLANYRTRSLDHSKQLCSQTWFLNGLGNEQLCPACFGRYFLLSFSMQPLQRAWIWPANCHLFQQLLMIQKEKHHSRSKPPKNRKTHSKANLSKVSQVTHTIERKHAKTKQFRFCDLIRRDTHQRDHVDPHVVRG